jgi:hypothetical protein
MDIEGRVISDAPEIVPGSDDLRAIDVLEPFAALFRFGVGHGGGWSVDCSIAKRISPEGWFEMTGGGGMGAGYEVPFRPSRDKFGGSSLSIFGSSGMHLDDHRDAVVLVRGLYGFAAPEVRSILVRSGSEKRTVAVDSPAGAFVVVVVGKNDVELHGARRAWPRDRRASKAAWP